MTDREFCFLVIGGSLGMSLFNIASHLGRFIGRRLAERELKRSARSGRLDQK